MPRYDIIIPHYGKAHLTDLCRKCLETIREHSTDYRILFVDNGSPEFHLIEPELQKHPHTVIRNTKNLGFVLAVNQALAFSTAPFVVLMNNDTEAAPGWLSKLEGGFALPERVGLVGARTDARGSWQGKWRGTVGTVLLETHRMLAFFCTMFKREVFQECGFLDEAFADGLGGLGDDDYYCWKVQQAGWRLALVQDLVIPHHHRSTFRTLYTPEQIGQAQKEAIQKFYFMSGRKERV